MTREPDEMDSNTRPFHTSLRGRPIFNVCVMISRSLAWV